MQQRPSLAPTPARLDSLAAPDRRRHPRYHLTLAVTLEGDNNFYTGLSEDISQSGIFIATCHILPLGTQVTLEFVLPRATESIRLHGTVQWIREADLQFGGAGSCYGSHVKAGMGVQFRGVDQVTAAQIIGFMRQRMPDFYD